MLELQQVSDVDNGSDIVQRITAMLDTASAEQPSPSPPPALAGSTPGGSSGSASPTPPPALAGAPLHHAHPQHQALHHHHHHHPLSPLRSLSVAPPGVLPPQAHRSLSEGETSMSITDLLGLNVPRGTLLGSNSSLNSPSPQLYDPSQNSRFFQEEPHYLDMMDASGFHTPLHNPCAFRSSPAYSDCGSPTGVDQSLLPASNNSGSTSNSPVDSDLNPNSVDAGSLANLINYLSLYRGNEQQQEQQQQQDQMTSLRFLQQQQHNLQASFLSQFLQSPQSPDGQAATCFPLSAPLGLSLSSSCQQRSPPQSQQQSRRVRVPSPLHPLTPPELGSPLQWRQSPSLTSSQSRNSGAGNSGGGQVCLERAARFHKNAASLVDATCTWSGTLPPRSVKSGAYSCKVFLGGVPWDMGEAALVNELHQFGQIRIEWPGKEQSASQPKGYVYAILESERKVRELLNACTQELTSGGSWYFKISSKKMKAKEVQVIPWLLSDSNYIKYTSQKLDPQKTVFVGALHGMLNAEGLAKIMNDLFGGVIYVGIDTDKYKYPIGSGRVTFNNPRSYMRAVVAAFIEIKTPRFTKKVQVDPYLEDSLCSSCGLQQGPYFCRDMVCFRYFCRTCWHRHHDGREQLQTHKTLMRNSKGSRATPISVPGFSAPSLSSPSFSSMSPPTLIN
ncbi:uncharacterized protein LOC126293616 [Schistocerca gregaria]|uniref:uncharacterized protein LOC126293616 n=1 Tax=Schistocerca gregaria TaxID=7010 RepID=UPI00211ED998|nr:uncharacterized protein LOC126293616 [Schistocerca gregaria]